jgi:phosphoribosylglycinamide formyltransferase-1
VSGAVSEQHAALLPVVVLISGSGSNLQALIDQAGVESGYRVVGVISNRADAYGLQRAAMVGIDHWVLDHRAYPDRASYDEALRDLIDRQEPGLVALAGFMRILSPAFVRHYRGRLLNIHPSLLPKYKGLHTHQRVLQAADSEHGASVHFVTEELDGGPVILQARIGVRQDEDAEQLARRVLAWEHRIYPETIRWFAAGRLALREDCAWLDGEPLRQPRQFVQDDADR